VAHGEPARLGRFAMTTYLCRFCGVDLSGDDWPVIENGTTLTTWSGTIDPESGDFEGSMMSEVRSNYDGGDDVTGYQCGACAAEVEDIDHLTVPSDHPSAGFIIGTRVGHPRHLNSGLVCHRPPSVDLVHVVFDGEVVVAVLAAVECLIAAPSQEGAAVEADAPDVS
jgi:hypothetical protein